jgi:hypothetical protein
MNNGNYGGAFVLTDEQNTEVGGNFIAITNIDQINKPTVEDFKKSEVYIRRSKNIYIKNLKPFERWEDNPQIALFTAASFRKEEIKIEVIGNLKMYKKYKHDNNFMGFPWNALLQKMSDAKDYEKQNGAPKTKIKLSKWTKWHWV